MAVSGVAPVDIPAVRATVSAEDAAASSLAVDEADRALRNLEKAMADVETALKHCSEDKKKEVRAKLESVSSSMAQAQQVQAIGKICVRAHAYCEQLRPTFFRGGEIRDRKHMAFVRGGNKKGVVRVLVNVKTVLDIFRNASYEQYVAAGLVMGARDEEPIYAWLIIVLREYWTWPR